ncbi:MAG TPA: phenylalanine--tRNA ligase subunit beta [Mycobacteriales bacterium]|nr:phenylalanine--tRNA ligase subunit beta [Mycobacteriales bacterium]
MRVPLSWLRDHVELPESLTARELATALIRIGLEVEAVEEVGADLTGPLVVGEVREIEELAGYRKPIRWCQVDVGETGGKADGETDGETDGASVPRGIICGATNFAVGDHVVVALPGAVLPGGVAIAARPAYDRVSDGMICSVRELGLGEDHTGILVLDGDTTVGADALEVLGLPDAVLDIAVTPDRGYCLSLRGMAREAAHALGVPFHDPAAEPASEAGAEAEVEPGWPVQVDDPVGCDRFSALTVTGLDPAAESPSWLRRRLLLAGMRPISLAVDVTNYVMLELGQPMHAFDRARLTGEILVRRAVPHETLRTLDGVTRILDGDDLVVTDDSGPIALAGVMGGASTEIGPATIDVVLEAAHWDPPTIMRMVRRHKLPSEAARRFERGVDPEVALPALRRAAALLAAHGGGRSGGLTVVGARRSRPHIALAADRPGRLAGRPIPSATVAARLGEVGCVVEGEYILTVEPPSWRPDLVDPADLIEEVIRLEGYDTVPARLPAAPAGRGLTAGQRAHRSVGRALAEAGYAEVLSYPFLSPKRFDDLGLPADDLRRRAVRLVNPLSDEQPLMRTSLLPGLLDTLARNVRRGLRDVALFETGLVYWPREDTAPPPDLGVDRAPAAAELAALERALPRQPRQLAVVACGDRTPPGWWGPGEPVTWADPVEAARLVAATVGVEVSVRAAERAPWHPGRCAAVVSGEQVVGHAGELHPRVVAALDLPARTCVMELDLDALGTGGPVHAPRVSAFPPALLDVALTVPAAVPAAEVESALRSGAGELLESLRLFDLYADPAKLGEGRKSLAYALRFRAPDRTLTVEEANAAKQAAVEEASRRTGAVLRT